MTTKKKATNIAITEQKKNKSHISYMPKAFRDKAPDFTDELVLQYDVPTLKNTSLDYGNDDD